MRTQPFLVLKGESSSCPVCSWLLSSFFWQYFWETPVLISALNQRQWISTTQTSIFLYCLLKVNIEVARFRGDIQNILKIHTSYGDSKHKILFRSYFKLIVGRIVTFDDVEVGGYGCLTESARDHTREACYNHDDNGKCDYSTCDSFILCLAVNSKYLWGVEHVEGWDNFFECFWKIHFFIIWWKMHNELKSKKSKYQCQQQIRWVLSCDASVHLRLSFQIWESCTKNRKSNLNIQNQSCLILVAANSSLRNINLLRRNLIIYSKARFI